MLPWISVVLAAEPPSDPACAPAAAADGLGLAQWRRGERAEALVTWHAGLDQADFGCDEAADLCTHIGYAHLEGGRFLMARSWLVGCGEAPTTMLNLADAERRLGWLTDAREHYADALPRLVGAQADRARVALGALGEPAPPRSPVACSSVAAVSGEVAVALCTGGLVRTEDGGRTWTPVELDDLVQVDADDGVITLLRWISVDRSADGGRTFTSFQRPKGITRIQAVGGAVFGLGPRRTLVTSDGRTWRRMAFPEPIAAIDGVWGNDSVLYATAMAGSSGDDQRPTMLLRSTDRGTTWSIVHRFDLAYYNAVVGGAVDDHGAVVAVGYYRQGNGGAELIARSADGVTWIPALDELPQPDATSFCARTAVWLGPDEVGVVLGTGLEACAAAGSTDGGLTWHLPAIVPKEMLEGVVDANGTPDGVVWAAGGGGLFRSADAGVSWALVSP